MVLNNLIKEEIEKIGSEEIENPDYGSRVEEILDSYSNLPGGENKLERELKKYREELEEKEITKEQYISDLSSILESDKDLIDPIRK